MIIIGNQIYLGRSVKVWKTDCVRPQDAVTKHYHARRSAVRVPLLPAHSVVHPRSLYEPRPPSGRIPFISGRVQGELAERLVILEAVTTWPTRKLASERLLFEGIGELNPTSVGLTDDTLPGWPIASSVASGQCGSQYGVGFLDRRGS